MSPEEAMSNDPAERRMAGQALFCGAVTMTLFKVSFVLSVIMRDSPCA